MMGAVVFGLIFAGLFTGLRMGIYIIENSRDLTQVAEILLKESEDIRTRTWAMLETYPQDAAFQPDDNVSAIFGDRYTCRRELGDRKADQKELILTVSWNDSRGIAHQRRFHSYLTKEGIHDYNYRAF